MRRQLTCRATAAVAATVAVLVLSGVLSGVLTGVLTGAQAGAQSGGKVVTLWGLNAYDILYVLSGGGENAVALMRDDGVVLVDPLPVGWGKATLDAIATVCDQPVRTIVNIRASEDHLRANAEYPTATRIVAHRSVVERAAKTSVFSGAAAKFAPNVTVTDQLSLLDGPDVMELHYLGAGRTNGDMVVFFPKKGTVYLGDLFPEKAPPVVDAVRGGSWAAFPETLAKVRTGIAGTRRVVIAGHEPPREGAVGANKPGAVMPIAVTLGWKDFEEYADFVRDFVAGVREAKQAGRTPEQAVAGLRLERYKGYSMQTAGSAAAGIYAE